MLTIETVPTPALVIDLPRVRKNLATMAAYAAMHGIKLRPHFKTHKTRYFADLQIKSGATGLTFAKVGEAEVVGAAAGDCLLAYPTVDAERTRRIAALAKDGMGGGPVRVTVDSAMAVEHLAAAASAAGSTVGILVDQDVGYHRTGVQTAEHVLFLAQLAAKTRGVRFDGLFVYPGHVRGTAQEQAPELARINSLVEKTSELLKKNGLPCGIVSGGSTPTLLQSHLMPAVTEIRPGTYIFNDRNTLLAGACVLEDCAAHIVATVVSNAVPNKVVIDAGSKALTSDRASITPDVSGYGMVLEHPKSRIVRLTEEHGEIDLSDSPTRPELGERVNILPNHICPCINLRDSVWLQEEGKAELLPLAIDARGMVV